MGKEFMPLFLDFNENTQDLSDEQCGRLVRALVNYANGKEYELDGMELLAFRFLKSSIDRNERLSAIRAEAGSKGGKQTQANSSKTKQNEADESKAKQKRINTNNDNKTNNKTNNKKDNDNRFERFWAEYPRKESKPSAKRAFDKLNVDESLLETMISAIRKQKSSQQWNENNGQYIPYPATWLNNQRWLDELKPMTQASVSAQQYDQRDYSDVQAEMLDRQRAEIEEKLRRKAAV